MPAYPNKVQSAFARWLSHPLVYSLAHIPNNNKIFQNPHAWKGSKTKSFAAATTKHDVKIVMVANAMGFAKYCHQDRLSVALSSHPAKNGWVGHRLTISPTQAQPYHTSIMMDMASEFQCIRRVSKAAQCCAGAGMPLASGQASRRKTNLTLLSEPRSVIDKDVANFEAARLKWQADQIIYTDGSAQLDEEGRTHIGGCVCVSYHIILQYPRFHEEREVYLWAHLDNLEGPSIWYLFNEPGAQSAVAVYLLSTGLMVH